MFFLPEIDIKKNFMTLSSYKNKVDRWIDDFGLVNLLLCFLVLVEIGSFLSLYLEVLEIKVWRHDELLMLDYGYLGKLKGEGRWVNYLLFPYLVKLNPQIAIALSLVCWGYFSYVVAERFTNKILFSILFTFASLQIPAYYSIIGWPVTLLPTMLILAFLTWLSSRVSPGVLFALGGFLTFGGFNNFYNLLPLLLLSPLSSYDKKRALKCFCVWILFYLTGYAIAIIFIKFIGGSWGLRIESWRNPNRLDSFQDLIINLKLVKGAFSRHVKLMGPILVPVILIFSFCLFLKDFFTRSQRRLTFPFLATLAVAFACYAQALPMGLDVYDRTAFPMFSAILCLTLFIFQKNKLLGSCLCSILCLNCYLLNVESVHYFQIVTSTWLKHLQEIPVDPKSVEALHFCGTDKDVAKSVSVINKSQRLRNYHNEGLGAILRFQPAARAAGFYNFYSNNKSCSEIKDFDTTNSSIFKWKLKEHQLYLRFK